MAKQTIKLNETQLKQLVRESLKNILSEKARSKSQQRFMGMVDAYKKGDMPDASPAIKKAAKSMTKKEVKDFAKTKHKGLPEHVDESIDNNVYTMEDWRRDGSLRVKEGQMIAPEVYWQLRDSVPPMSDGQIFQTGEAYDHDPQTGKALYQTFKKEGHDSYRYVGLMPANGRTLEEGINEISDDTVDSAYMKAMSDTNRYEYDDPMGVRRRAQAANLKKMRDERLGFDPVAMTAKMRQNGTSGDPSVDRRWARWQKNHNDRVAGKRQYNQETGRWTTINESRLNKAITESIKKILK